MREVVFRERQERVASFSGMAKMLGRMFNMDAGRVFSDVIADYASEVFQEDYDADLMRQKIAGLRAAQRAIAAKRDKEKSLVTRLDKMGEYYDNLHGRDIRSSTVKPPSR